MQNCGSAVQPQVRNSSYPIPALTRKRGYERHVSAFHSPTDQQSVAESQVGNNGLRSDWIAVLWIALSPSCTYFYSVGYGFSTRTIKHQVRLTAYVLRIIVRSPSRGEILNSEFAVLFGCHDSRGYRSMQIVVLLILSTKN